MDPEMTPKFDITLRDLARVIFSGTASYLAVHFALLPFLVRMDVGFPAYFYIGAIATAVGSVAISLALQPREAGPVMHPAE